MPESIEVLMASFGYSDQPVYMSRQAAERYAVQLAGKSYTNLRIIRAYLENDTPGGTKGRVIAVCEPLQAHPEPYRPRMEYK